VPSQAELLRSAAIAVEPNDPLDVAQEQQSQVIPPAQPSDEFRLRQHWPVEGHPEESPTGLCHESRRFKRLDRPHIGLAQTQVVGAAVHFES
jgi:hypothetical protein